MEKVMIVMTSFTAKFQVVRGDVVVSSNGVVDNGYRFVYRSVRKARKMTERLIDEWLASYSEEFGKIPFVPVPVLATSWWADGDRLEGRYTLTGETAEGPRVLAQWSLSVHVPGRGARAAMAHWARDVSKGDSFTETG